MKIYGCSEHQELSEWSNISFNMEDFALSSNERYMLSFVGHSTGKNSSIDAEITEKKEVKFEVKNINLEFIYMGSGKARSNKRADIG